MQAEIAVVEELLTGVLSQVEQLKSKKEAEVPEEVDEEHQKFIAHARVLEQALDYPAEKTLLKALKADHAVLCAGQRSLLPPHCWYGETQ